MNKNDVKVALQIAVNSSFPLKKDAIGFDGMIENYSMFIKSMHGEKVINNLKYIYGVSPSENGNVLCIAFRGSSNEADWKYNFQFAQKRMEFNMMPYGYQTSSGVGIHSGFRDDYKQAEESVHDIVKTFLAEYSISKLLIVGHSLGGALAHICALDMQFNYGDRLGISCVSFGAPRVFNSAGVASYNRRVPETIRVVNASDPVPRVPLSVQGYEHVDNEMHVNTEAYGLNPFNWFAPIMLLAFWDHSPSLYRKGIEKFSDNELYLLQGI